LLDLTRTTLRVFLFQKYLEERMNEPLLNKKIIFVFIFTEMEFIIIQSLLLLFNLLLKMFLDKSYQFIFRF
jgi:hypothetical protein